MPLKRRTRRGVFDPAGSRDLIRDCIHVCSLAEPRAIICPGFSIFGARRPHAAAFPRSDPLASQISRLTSSCQSACCPRYEPPRNHLGIEPAPRVRFLRETVRAGDNIRTWRGARHCPNHWRRSTPFCPEQMSGVTLLIRGFAVGVGTFRIWWHRSSHFKPCKRLRMTKRHPSRRLGSCQRECG
jgi:hypothetical protein